MTLKSRLTFHFFFNLLTLFLCVCIITFFCTYLYLFHWIPATDNISRGTVDLLRSLPRATYIQNQTVSVGNTALKQIHPGTWLEILDDNGNAVYEYQVPQDIPRHYSPGRLAYDRANPDQINYNIYTWYDRAAGQKFTWLYGVPYSLQRSMIHLQFVFLGSLFAGSLIVTLVVGLLFGRRLALPLLHMMEWLQGISRGHWEEPAGDDSTPRSISSWNGQLRRPYRLYREVMGSLHHLADALQSSEEQHKHLERTREEWITGVSHDVRTPLSSVKGYAALLSNPDAVWTQSEVVRFSQIIERQAEYIQDLLDDFNLIYRLRNGALPLSVAECDVVELVRRTVIDLVNHPGAREQVFAFDSKLEKIMYPVDARWFQRAVSNLLANASLHNPSGTHIQVSVTANESTEHHYPSVSITITDDGNGMDPETAAHMFDRYFRGTNTGDAEGRGTGLGSAIAKQLLHAHHATIDVHTAVGKGTTIQIQLPACDTQRSL